MSDAITNAGHEHSCPQCPKRFKRLEHLKRHKRAHEGSRVYACSLCPKTFARSDILRRHASTHDAADADTSSGPRRRACLECARVRERCSKEAPCSRCRAKSVSCEYPPTMLLQADEDAVHQTLAPWPQPGQYAPEPSSVPSTTHVQEQDYPYPCGSLVAADNTYTDQQQQGLLLDRSFLEMPVNWLPLNTDMDLDYNSILGHNFGLVAPVTVAPTATFGLDNGTMRIPPAQDVGSNSGLGASASPEYPTSVPSLPEAPPSEHVRPSPITSQSSESPLCRKVQGDLYSNSVVGARTPCTTRFKRNTRTHLLGATSLKPIQPENGLRNGSASCCYPGFPEVSHIDWRREGEALPPGHAQVFTPETFMEIQTHFARLCLSSSDIFTPFANHRFLRFQDFELFVHLYFKHFNPVFPMLHPAVDDINCSWLLTLAVCATGCQYAEAEEYSACVEPLHEFLRRALCVSNHETPLQGSTKRAWAIARALNQCCSLYRNPGQLRSAVQNTDNYTTASLVLFDTAVEGKERCNDFMAGWSWEQRLEVEAEHRISFFTMLLDTMSSYLLGLDTYTLPSGLLQLTLPDEPLWFTATSEEWAATSQKEEVPTLFDALETIFRYGTFDSRLCNFGQLVLLHGLYSHIRTVEKSVQGPLWDWTPSLNKTTNTTRERDLPSQSETSSRDLLSNWRNAGLDCIDVFHWAANGKIAAASGLEHPLVMHLHFSRTVISAPLTSIRSLVTFLTPNVNHHKDKSICKEDAVSAEHRIIEWAQRDQYKARLAVLHCGCFFWHIRRYSCKAFYEPNAIFLATLTIWAYSSYASRSDLQQQQHNDTSPSAPSGVSDESDTEPSFVRLDRPNDDEMVQSFVRSGGPGQMKAYITGVGDIYAAKSPPRILREGMKILSAVSTAWGRDSTMISALQALSNVMEQNRSRPSRETAEF